MVLFDVVSAADSADKAHNVAQEATVDESTLSWLISELTGSYVNWILIGAIAFLAYKILRPNEGPPPAPPADPLPPPLKKRDFTAAQLKEFDGSDAGKRLLIACNGKVFDVTRGRRFYGPGGPYSAFAGRDASRGLATFSVSASETEYDDLSDLKPSEMEQVREWEMQFSEKYDLVGKLLRPGEEPTNYSDDEGTNAEDDAGKKEK